MKKANKYAQHPEHIIDLHGYTTAETQELLDELIDKEEYKYVRIIIGRGHNSENGPVLPNFVKRYLDARDIHYNQSKIQDGGEGALEVFL